MISVSGRKQRAESFSLEWNIELKCVFIYNNNNKTKNSWRCSWRNEGVGSEIGGDVWGIVWGDLLVEVDVEGGTERRGKKKSSVFQLKISVTSFLLHHILNSTCVQGVVCLSALGKKHNPCPRNICQRPTAGQRDAATRPFSEESAPRASFMKPRFIPTIELFSFFLLQKKKKNYYEWFLSVVLIVFFFFFCVSHELLFLSARTRWVPFYSMRWWMKEKYWHWCSFMDEVPVCDRSLAP